MKKIIAILSVFALLFGLASCKSLEGNLEGETSTTKVSIEEIASDVNATELFIDDGQGHTIPVETKVDSQGQIIYAYKDQNGNEVTQTNKDNIIGVTKYSEEQKEDAFKDFISSLDNVTQPSVKVDFVLSEKLIDEKLFTKVEVPLGSNGKPIRDDGTSYQEIIKGDKFTVRMSSKSIMGGNETKTPMVWIKSGKSMLMQVTAPVSATGADDLGLFGDHENATMSILVKDGKTYMIVDTMKFYMELPDDSVEEMFNPEIFNQEIEDNTTYVASYEVKINSKTYAVDEFKSEDGKAITRNYYDDKNKPVRIEMISGDDYSIMEFTEVSATADTAKLQIPSGYLDVTALMGSELEL